MNSGSQAVLRPREQTPLGSGIVSTSPAQTYDVAIVGLGPVGSVAAALLGQAGLRVYACERKTKQPEHPRAVTLDDDVLRVLDQVGALGDVLPELQPFTASHCYGVDGELIQSSQPQRDAISGRRQPRSYVLCQRALDRALRRRLLLSRNITLGLGRELTALHQSASDVKLDLCQIAQSGITESIRARWLLACDGASSIVRQTLGIELENVGFDETWLVVDALIGDSALAKLPQVTSQFCEPTRPCHYTIAPGSHRRWELSLQHNEHAGNPRELAWQLLSRWIGREEAELSYVGRHRFSVSLAQRWRSGRIFLAGDAAQTQPPFVGQGLCQGIRDVANLTWKLAAVQQGRVTGHAAERLLKSYNSERRDLSYRLLQRASAMCALLTERDAVKARERDELLLAERRRLVYRPEVENEWLPQLESGFLGPDTGARGLKFPEARIRLAAGDAVTMDHHFGFGWRLVMDPLLPFPTSNSGLDIVPIGGRGFIESESIVADWMRQHDCHAVLLRPDHYVYGAAATAETLRRLLDHWRRSQRDK